MTTIFTEKQVREATAADRLPELQRGGNANAKRFILELPFSLDERALRHATIRFQKRQYTIAASSTRHVPQEANGPHRYFVVAVPSHKQHLEDEVEALASRATVEMSSSDRERFHPVLKQFGAGLLELAMTHLSRPMEKVAMHEEDPLGRFIQSASEM